MNPRPLAAAALAVGFGIVTYTAVVIEPRMGFEAVSDFFDPAKVAVGYASTAWLVSNLVYLSLPIAIWMLAVPSDDPHRVWSGVTAGLLLFVIGVIDRIGILLPSLVGSEEAVRASLVAILPVRFALLKTFVFTLAIFAWRTTRTGWGTGPVDRAWRAFGYLMLLLGAAFVFAFIPAPLVIVAWALALTVREARPPVEA